MSRYLLAPALVSFAALVFLNANALAHPGHAVEVTAADSPMHYIVQPEHAAIWAVLAIGTWLVVRSLQHRRHATA